MKPFGDPTSIQRDYLPNEFKQESQKHEIIGSVHVQCDGAIPDPVKESIWLESLYQNHKLPSAHIGFLDLNTTQAPEVLEQYRALSNFRGIRQILSRIPNRPEISFANVEHLHNQIWQENFSLLATHKLTFDLQLYPQQMANAASFFAKHPNTPIVIDHAGSPYDQSEAGLLLWREGLSKLAQLPHCQIKLSGFGMFDQQWNAQSIQAITNTIFELFGVERVMFGSNYPVDKLMKSYDFVVDNIIQSCLNAGLTELDIQQVFHDNAHQFYKL